MAISNEFREIFNLPLAQVATVYNKITGLPPTTKASMVARLCEEVETGRNSLPAILGAIKSADKYVNVNGVAPTQVDTATTDVANRAHASALDALAEINKLSTSTKSALTTLSKSQQDLTADVCAIRVAVESINSQDVNLRVTQQISDALAPFLQVVADQGAQAIVAQAVSVTVQDRKTAKDLFGIDVKDVKGRDLIVDIYNHPDAPAIDPNFIWTETIIRHLLLSQATGENLFFGGEKGTGKTQTVEQFCAMTGRAFTRINFHKYSTQSEYIGDIGADAGTTSFKPGAFLTGFTTPGTIILLDEISMCPPGELAPLNGLLEPNSKVNIGGQVWRRAPGVLVIGADNTLTNGDDSGRYGDTNQMNSALADRFARVIRFEHLTEEQEIDAVARHTSCDPSLARHIVEVVRVARAKVTSGDLVDAPSIRSVVAFVRALQVLPVKDAWYTAIANRQPAESAIALEGIRQTHLSEKTIQAYL